MDFRACGLAPFPSPPTFHMPLLHAAHFARLRPLAALGPIRRAGDATCCAELVPCLQSCSVILSLYARTPIPTLTPCKACWAACLCICRGKEDASNLGGSRHHHYIFARKTEEGVGFSKSYVSGGPKPVVLALIAEQT